MKAQLTAALLLLLSTPVFAQTAADPGTTGVQTVAPIMGGAAGNPGGLDFGRGSASGIGNAGAPAGAAATSAGQLGLGRTTTGGGGVPGGGASIGSSAAGVPGTDDEYTHPIYGSGRR